MKSPITVYDAQCGVRAQLGQNKKELYHVGILSSIPYTPSTQSSITPFSVSSRTKQTMAEAKHEPRDHDSFQDDTLPDDVKVVPSFDEMPLHTNLLRGIYSYGYVVFASRLCFLSCHTRLL